MNFNKWKLLVHDNDIIEFANIIDTKILLWYELPSSITKWYNIKLNKFIISFDIEFQNILSNNKNLKLERTIYNYTFFRGINEIGGMIIYHYDNKYYLILLFYVNMPIITSNLDKLFLLHSEYSGTTENTMNKIHKLENKLFIHNSILQLINFNNPNILNINDLVDDVKNQIFNKLISNKLFKKFFSKSRLKELLNKDITVKRFYKYIKGPQYLINGLILKKYKLYNEYQLYLEINKLIINDPEVKRRTIKDPYKFLKLLNIILSKAFILVKGDLDFTAILNHSKHFNIKFIKFNKKNIFDISLYNENFHKICKSAELSQNIECLKDLGALNHLYEYYKYIENNIHILGHSKAHNPLTDAFFTWIIYCIVINKKLNIFKL